MRALGCAHKVKTPGTSPTFMPMHPSSHPRITLCSPTNVPFPYIINMHNINSISVDHLHPPNQDGKTLPAHTQQQGLADFRRASPIGNSYGSWSGSRVLQNFVPFSRVPVQCTLTMLPFCTWNAQRRVIDADKRHVLLFPRPTSTYTCTRTRTGSPLPSLSVFLPMAWEYILKHAQKRRDRSSHMQSLSAGGRAKQRKTGASRARK